MAERRKRISLYVGPKNTIKRADLDDYDNGEWVAEIKHDGEWCLVEIENGHIVEMSSRTGLSHDGIEDFIGKRVTGGGSGKLVGELVADQKDDDTRTGDKRLHLFDVLEWGGMDLRDLVLEERHKALRMIVHMLTLLPGRIFIVEQRSSGFKAWYDAIMSGSSRVIGKRAEGLVLKKKGTPLRAVNSDGKVDFWVRCKPKNTIDYIVMGPDGFAAKGTPKVALGLIFADGSLRKCMSLSWIKPKDWPANVPTSPHGPAAGMIVEVEGAEVFPTGALRHGHIKRPRLDKPVQDCTLEAAVALK